MRQAPMSTTSTTQTRTTLRGSTQYTLDRIESAREEHYTFTAMAHKGLLLTNIRNDTKIAESGERDYKHTHTTACVGSDAVSCTCSDFKFRAWRQWNSKLFLLFYAGCISWDTAMALWQRCKHLQATDDPNLLDVRASDE